MEITGRTRLTGLFGDPVMHSRSPSMHNAAYLHLRLPFVYLPFRVAGDQLPAAVRAIRALDMAGVNITVPHKEAVIPYLDRLDETALRCGAVNTIVNREGVLTGYNTDGLGFLDSLSELGFELRKKKAVILGAGGSARAVAAALLDVPVKSLLVLNRTVEKAKELAAALGAGDKISIFPLKADAVPDLAEAELVVNTLSVPFKQRGSRLVNLEQAKKALFYDLRYGSMPSGFLDYAKELGRPGVDGSGMLLHQGARAFILITGREAPLEVMRKALL
ncbi:MAG TPA: shikimate dehydrogenase [Firmicutes bacterium]|nr:shikimate dehydrogenase [Bacillota bacterium]